MTLEDTLVGVVAHRLSVVLQRGACTPHRARVGLPGTASLPSDSNRLQRCWLSTTVSRLSTMVRFRTAIGRPRMACGQNIRPTLNPAIHGTSTLLRGVNVGRSCCRQTRRKRNSRCHLDSRWVSLSADAFVTPSASRILCCDPSRPKFTQFSGETPENSGTSTSAEFFDPTASLPP